jgi:hypothetical protein
MFRTILLGHLFTRECRPLPTKYNPMERNHPLVDLSLLEDDHPMEGLPLLGTTPFSCSSWRETSLCQSYLGRQSTAGGGETIIYWKPFTILGSIFRGIFTQPHVGGHLYHNPKGRVSNLVPSGPSYGKPYPGGIPNTTWSPQGKQPYPPHGSNVYPPLGSTPYPPQGYNVHPLSGQTNHPSYNAHNPPGYANVSQPSSNLVYPSQQQPYVGGPTSYNYPPSLVYGPTGVPMPHQYHRRN